MRWLVGLLALSLIGADAPKGPGTPMIAFQVTVLEMNDLGWRTTLHKDLSPVCRQGSATVWTAGADTAARISDQAGRVVCAPRVSTFPGARATVVQNKTRALVGDVVRVSHTPDAPACGPDGACCFAAKREDAKEDFSASLSGRGLDQGVLATVTLKDTRITAVHPVACEGVKESPAEPTARYEVPEFARCEVSGEWLIPNDGALVVSLGVHTVADANGRAVARERVALIRGSQVVTNEGPAFEAKGVAVTGVVPNLVVERPGVDHPAPPPPAVPSRCLPLAFNADGEPMTLPPLPEDVAPVTALPGSSDPCATPQSRTALTGTPITPRDPESTRAGFDRLTDCCGDDPECSAMTEGAVKTFQFRSPNGRFELRLRARVVRSGAGGPPLPSPGAPGDGEK